MSIFKFSVKKKGDLEENREHLHISSIDIMSSHEIADSICNYFKQKEINYELCDIEILGHKAAIVKHRDLDSIENIDLYTYLIVPGLGILHKDHGFKVDAESKKRSVKIRNYELFCKMKENNDICLCDLEKKCICSEFKERDICKCGVYLATYV